MYGRLLHNKRHTLINIAKCLFKQLCNAVCYTNHIWKSVSITCFIEAHPILVHRNPMILRILYNYSYDFMLSYNRHCIYVYTLNIHSHVHICIYCMQKYLYCICQFLLTRSFTNILLVQVNSLYNMYLVIS